MTDDIRTIEARHTQDDVWFRAGHHDPNGYIGMAHADRGALLEMLRKLRPGNLSNVQRIEVRLIDDCGGGVGRVCAVSWWQNGTKYGTCIGEGSKGGIYQWDSPLLDEAKPPAGMTMCIPKDAWRWLMGEGPDDDGENLVDLLQDTAEPARRVRTTFRRMCGL